LKVSLYLLCEDIRQHPVRSLLQWAQS